PNSGGFSINGLIGADRIPHPHYYQAKKVYQNIGFSLEENGQVRLKNKFYFTDLDEFDYRYKWLSRDAVIDSGNAVLNGELLEIPPAKDALCLNVYAVLKNATLWADKEFVVAKEQFVINSPSIEPIVQSGGKVSMTEKSGELVVTGRKDIFTINLASGALTSWRSNGVELLKGDLEPYFWKPPNDNQKQNGYVNRLGLWKNAPQ